MANQNWQSNPPRATARIDAKLEKKLAAYMAAAAAAGASLLGAQGAEAKVVFTPTNRAVTGTTAIDLNNDGITDFTLAFHEIDKSIVLFVQPQVAGNEMRVGNGGAAAGFFGVPVGGGEKFLSSSGGYGWGELMAASGCYSTCWFFGPWAHASNRYLGFKFVIDGQTHYGWARLSVPNLNQAVLTGYAYETVPGKTIIEGHTSGPEAAGNFMPADLLAPAPQLMSLGVLARGADGLAIWRREESLTR
jgi:hypothetical protein